jgi:hypothetical protein
MGIWDGDGEEWNGEGERRGGGAGLWCGVGRGAVWCVRMGIGEGRFGGLFVLVLLVLVLVLVLVLWCGVLGWAVPRRARVLRSTVRTSAEGFLAWFLDPGFASYRCDD